MKIRQRDLLMKRGILSKIIPLRQMSQTQESAVRKPGPIRLTFSTLPSHIREKLLDRQKGKGRHFSWQTKDMRIEFGCVIGALIWICILFYWTDDYRWTETQLLWFGAFTIVCSLGIAIGILGLWRWKRFPMRGAVFVTPLYFIKCRFDNLWYWGSGRLLRFNR